jgi:GNAT superfamily N-acetyltransferase
MPSTVIPIEEAGAWAAGIGRAMPDAARRGLLAAAYRIVGAIKTLDLPLDRGTARAGWRAEQVPAGAAIFNTVLEAVLMEGGVRPQNIKIGRKMIDALAEWARRKGIGSQRNQTASGRVTKGRPADELYRSVAWAIATKMKRTGIFHPETGGLQPLAKTTRRLGPQYIREEVARELRRAFGAT